MDRAVFEICDDTTVRCFSIGNEKEPLVIVDSFMRGIDQIKYYAIENHQFHLSESYYPGIRMPVSMDYTVALAKHLGLYIKKFFGCDMSYVTKAVSNYSIVTKSACDLDLLQRIPHFDSPSKQGLAAVHYLMDAPNSGTALFRHKHSGYEYIDSVRFPAYMARIQERYPSSSMYPTGYILGSTDEFEEILRIPAKYNRLVLYRGTSLHSGVIPKDYNFDPNPATGRLTLTSFYEFK
jgi:hypothetical protein